MKKLTVCAILLLTCFSLRAQMTAPEPVAGRSLTKDYITQNLVYPESDLAQNNSGKVVIGLHVDAKGAGSQYTVKSSFSEDASPVALHLVKTILWNPALINGLPIDQDTEYEVEFSARSYKRYWKKHERVAIPLTLEADSSYTIYEMRQLEELAKPYFPDGSNMATYILNNLEYPEAAKATEVQGKVRLDFVVETNGNVSNITVKNSVGGGCDNEAIRLLQGTHWIPAVKNDKYVRSHNTQDITFSIGSRNFQDGNSY